MSQIKKDKIEKEKEPASSSSSASTQVETPVKDLIRGIRADIKEMILTRDIPFSCYRGALHPEYLCDVRIVEYDTCINKYEQQPDCMVDEEEYARWVSVALWTTNPGADRYYWNGIYSDSHISGINESGNMAVAIKSRTLALHNINSMCTYPLIRRNNLNEDEGEYVNFWGCGRVTKEYKRRIESLNDELGLPFFQHAMGPLFCCMEIGENDWFPWCPRDISLLICSYNSPSTPEIDKNREERTSQFIIWDKEGINPLRKTCGLSMAPYRPPTPPLPPSSVAASSSSAAASKKRTASNVIEDEIEFSFSVLTKKRRTVLTAVGEKDNNDEDEEEEEDL